MTLILLSSDLSKDELEDSDDDFQTEKANDRYTI
jgi:hypothetical protein